ncbi:hypothetical protein [Salmonella enterica]|uniref:hypothetical protein n=1 Tax=Salmonella enterica TaxID=28901 RepID=UPI001CA4EA66|nr:hypothetical protein [Salmonella enterica]
MRAKHDADMSPSVVRAFGQTDVGLVRDANEDAFAMADLSKAERLQGGAVAEWPLKDGVLLLVSDGMGGAKAGEIARRKESTVSAWE